MIVESYVQAKKKKNHQVFLVLVCVFEGLKGWRAEREIG